jgi:hypothetical protein
MSEAARFSVVNPSFRLVQADAGESQRSALVPLAPRLDSLEGKVVYLVDTGFGGSYRFMQQLQRWFEENMPAVTTIRKRKPGNVFADDTTELWDEIRERGHAVILGVGG